ncbi:glycosyltransferase family 62 protein [Xylariaceae sp. FL0255]|nr:glycosyltransferase family 62 protein [Xylariaceae sp. FL0255]
MPSPVGRASSMMEEVAMSTSKAFKQFKFNRLSRYGINRFSLSRIGFVLAAFSLALLLVFTTEFRKRSWSCKTFASCLTGGGMSHSYQHWDDVDPDFKVDTFEKTMRDGTLYFHRQKSENSSPELVMLVLAQDADSWSKDYRSTRRNIYDFLDLLVSTKLDFTNVTLGFMTSSREEYDKAVTATEWFPFARVNIYFREETGPKLAFADRHKPQVQRERRSRIARLRNYLMLRTLRDENHVVWIDADVVEVSKDIIQTMQKHADANKNVGIITALCTQTRKHNYDRNAWALKRPTQDDDRELDSETGRSNDTDILDIMGPVYEDEMDAAVKQLSETRTYIPELIERTHDNDLIHVDSVGATILYMRASLLRQGVSFPTFNIVGTTWAQEGWSGIETEGLCYAASHAEGGGCFVLGGNHYVRHSDITWS